MSRGCMLRKEIWNVQLASTKVMWLLLIFVFEFVDVQFVIKKSQRRLEAFLKYYVTTHGLKKRRDTEISLTSEIFLMIILARVLIIRVFKPESMNQQIWQFPMELPRMRHPIFQFFSRMKRCYGPQRYYNNRQSIYNRARFPCNNRRSIYTRSQSSVSYHNSSSRKSVNISDKVEIIEDKVGYGSCENFCELEQNENRSYAPEGFFFSVTKQIQ